MWQKIKHWVFIEEHKLEDMPKDVMDEITKRALALYCEYCDTSFRTKTATFLHKRAKHKI